MRLLDAWASHRGLDRIVVPRAEHSGHGACYRVKDTECQAVQQTPAALVDSILTWQQRRLCSQVSMLHYDSHSKALSKPASWHLLSQHTAVDTSSIAASLCR